MKEEKKSHDLMEGRTLEVFYVKHSNLRTEGRLIKAQNTHYEIDEGIPFSVTPQHLVV